MRSTGLVDPDIASELLELSDPDAFAARVLTLAHSTSGVDEVFAYRLGAGRAPDVVAACSGLSDAESRREAYARRFHAHDPVAAVLRATDPGSGFEMRVPSGAIERGEYRKLCFERPRFVEKITYGWRKAEHALLVSFYHRNEASALETAKLSALAQLTIVGLSRLHARQLAGARAVDAEIEARLLAAHPILTPRERSVCAKTLAGMTARQIGDAIGLRASSVLTYRQRAYQKLQISRASELLRDIMADPPRPAI